MPLIDIEKYLQVVETTEMMKVIGKVIQVVGLIIEAQVQGVSVGELCNIEVEGEHPRKVEAEVVGFKEGKVLMMPLGSIAGISPGNKVMGSGHALQVMVGDMLLGRVLDGLGRPMDGKGAIVSDVSYPLDQSPPDPTTRPRIKDILPTSVKAIDGLLTMGDGQRLGIFAGSGVGKSTLLDALCLRLKQENVRFSLVTPTRPLPRFCLAEFLAKHCRVLMRYDFFRCYLYRYRSNQHARQADWTQPFHKSYSNLLFIDLMLISCFIELVSRLMLPSNARAKLSTSGHR